MGSSSERIPEKLAIMKAASEDAEQIRHLIRDSWVKTMNDTLGIPAEELEEVFQESMSDAGLVRLQEDLIHPPEGRSTFVAKDGTKVLGVCIVERGANEKGENELDVLHVLPGQTARGIGRSLWETSKMSLDPAKDTFLWTTPGTNAVEVYTRWGFQPTEYASEQLKTRTPHSRPRVKMVKKAEAVRE